MVFYWEILSPWESFHNMCLGTSLADQRLRHWVFTSGSAGLIPGQGTKISHAAQNGQKTKTENPRNQCLSWHFTQTTEAFLLPTENSLLHSSEFLGYYRMVPACFMTSQTILFFLPKCRLQTQVSHVHSLNRQWLSFRVWVSLHPHLPPEYSQVWSVIVISHSSRTLRAFVLEKVKVLIAQSCLILCHPTDCSPPGSSVHGILQARILDVLPFLLQGIFLTQGSNLGLLHCKPIFTIWATMGGGVLERPWVITLSLMSSSRTQTPVARARLAQGCTEWERWIGFSRRQRWL